MKITYSIIFLLGISFILLFFSSCNKKDDNINTLRVNAADGYYIKGDATALNSDTCYGLMKTAINQSNQTERQALKELYVAVTANSEGFNIVQVEDGVETIYGPGNNFSEVLSVNKMVDEPQSWFARGAVTKTNTPFTVPEDGLYHIIIDTEISKVVIAKVEWGLFGVAMPLALSASTPMQMNEFSLTEINFQVTNIRMISAGWTFRYSNSNKIVLDSLYANEDGKTGISINTNLGTKLTDLAAGIQYIFNSLPGYYTISLSWNLENGFTAVQTKTGEYTPPLFPESMYITGDATNFRLQMPGTNLNAKMHKAVSGESSVGLYWIIVYLKGNLGFRLSEANWSTPNIGFENVDESDGRGVVMSNLNGDISVAESAWYTVALEFLIEGGIRYNRLSIIPAEVYGIGDAFGTWTKEIAANKCTVDNVNNTFVSPPLPASGNIYLYARHHWFLNWQQTEFVINGAKIEYRNDSIEAPKTINGNAGQIISLNFNENTANIK
jgi:hypothetical protein